MGETSGWQSLQPTERSEHRIIFHRRWSADCE
jgi:hypothetical protein